MLLILLSLPCLSQPQKGLYLPVEFQHAFNSGTRSFDGDPGKNYWQNHSDYNLKAIIDPYKKTLAGEADITYYNESPDTLNSITVFLYPDEYAKRSSRDYDIDPNLLTDGVHIDSLAVDNMEVNLDDRSAVWRYGTRMFIRPKTPVLPDSSVQLHIAWNYIITANGEDRDGIYDSTSLFIGYWYPEIGVYDDIDGWNSIDHTGGVEFYHDYSNYKVELEVPDNFLVWASVPPDNEKDIYPDFILNRLADVNENKATPIVTKDDIQKGIRVKTNLWKYTANDFPDFCFALSDHYRWDARLYKNSDTYFLNTVYPEYHKRFAVNSQIEYEALGVFTTQLPAIPFPFRYFTAVNALHGGGMEYPGMINDGFYDTALISRPTTELAANRGLTYHEMFHMFFPFYMGINESKYSWMDEGWASFTSYLIPNEYRARGLYRFGELSVAPMMVPSNITPRDFYVNAYTIGAYSYYSLQQLLGQPLFLKCLQEYIHRWHHKHPTPYDYFNSFSNTSGKDLNWFWKRWYFDWGYVDLGIKGYNGKELTIQNIGGKPMAASVKLTFEDQSTDEVRINPSVWKESDTYQLSVTRKKKLISAELIIPYTGDVMLDNNTWMVK